MKSFFLTLVISALATIPVLSDDAYVCPSKNGFESKLIPHNDGSYSCLYENAQGEKESYRFNAISKRQALENAIANTIRSDKSIQGLPADKQRLAAMKSILKSKGLNEANAEAYLKTLDNDSSGSITDALEAISSDEDARSMVPLATESLKETENMLDDIKYDIDNSNLEMKSKPIKVNAHDKYENTLPAILSGVMTLDPYFFSSSGKASYIDNIGQLTIDSKFLNTIAADPSGQDTTPFVKYISVLKDTLGISSEKKQITIIDFVDRQILGFYLYLVASINAFYTSILHSIFLAGTIIFTGLAGGKYYKANHSNKLTAFFDKISKRFSGKDNDASFGTALTKIGTVGVAFAFFTAPVFYVPVDTSGPMSKAIYAQQGKDASLDYGYATPAQELIHQNIRFANYLGNLVNDYMMHGYILLLQNKMGMVKDVLPRFITETKQDIADLKADKESLASKAELFNKACRPYYKNGTFNIPLQKTASSKGGATIVIGDAVAEAASKKIQSLGQQSSYVKSETADQLASSVENAGVQIGDTVVFQVGYKNLKSGEYLGKPLTGEEWKADFTDDMQNAVITAKNKGARVYCSSPYYGGDVALKGTALAMRKAMSNSCDKIIELKGVPAQTSQESAIESAATDISTQTAGASADFVDAKGCEQLMKDIQSGAESMAKRASAIQQKANNVQGFSDNIAKKTPAAKSGKYGQTTDPTKVNPSNANIAGNPNVWRVHNGTFGSFTLPMSAHEPGWQYTGRVSTYGSGEKGTGKYTATGEDMGGFVGAKAFVGANWHLPLNTLIEVTSKSGQKFIIRTADRGPVVSYNQKFSPGQKVSGALTPSKAPPNAPHTSSDRWVDLPPIAYKDMCVGTDDWVSTRVVAYNASSSNPPDQPGQRPDGTIVVNPSQCKKNAGSLGGADTLSSNEQPYVLNVDNSPVTTMNDYIAMVSSVNDNFGWLSAATVPSSYEFYKYVNLFFINNAELDTDGRSSVFAQAAKSQLSTKTETDDSSNIMDIVDVMINDIAIHNATWFMVPGFSTIQGAIADVFERFLIKPSEDGNGELSSETIGSSLSIIKSISAGTVGAMLGVGFGGGGDGAHYAINGILGALTGIMLFSGSTVAVQAAITVMSMMIAIALMSMIVSVSAVLLVSAIIIIQAALFFINAAVFFLVSPITGILAAFSGDSGNFILRFFKQLIGFVFVPMLIAIPAYMYIPISELFIATLKMGGQTFLMVLQTGQSLLGTETGGVMTAAKGMLVRSSLAGILDILSTFATIFVIVIIVWKFRTWIKEITKIDEVMSGTSGGELFTDTKKYISPL